jgi:ketosteroid isomerase-like protein
VVQRELAAGRANSADSFAVVFTSEATVKPPNESPKTGPALQSWFKTLFDSFTVDQISYSDERIDVSGDMAVHYYAFDWTVSPKGGSGTQEKGHGVHVLRRQADSSWKIVYDTWSTDSLPPPPPPPPAGKD